MIRDTVRRADATGRAWTRRLKESISTPGLLVGTLFFAFSLTPSLLPRSYVMQGIISGLSMMAGYGIGVSGRWLWSYLELPLPGPRLRRRVFWIAAGLCLGTAILFLWQALGWQEAIRRQMGAEPVDSLRPFRVAAIALLVCTVLLGSTRLFHLTLRVVADRLDRILPGGVAKVLGVLVSVVLFWSVVEGVLFRYALRAGDASFQQVDALQEPELEAPASPLRSGSGGSLVSWEELGKGGREFVASGPTDSDLEMFFEEETASPIRVYVGLNAAQTVEERAGLALAELKRTGAFDRSVLVLVTPTGRGWIDPKAMDPFEYLHRGDVASVAVQYSYLPSWLSLLVEPEYGVETAEAVFDSVYGHWRTLGRGRRPKLILYGVSLGALNSQRSADLYDVVGDPFAGALWTGPPFQSERWRSITRDRVPGSPVWLPRFRDGSVVRFMNQDSVSAPAGARWGPIRMLYLQYASDPITFFEPEILWRKPQWLMEPRGPDVNDRLRWYPVVTMVQLAADLAVAGGSPLGYGHNYAPEDYIEAWLELTDLPGWTAAQTARLERLQGRRFSDGARRSPSR